MPKLSNQYREQLRSDMLRHAAGVFAAAGMNTRAPTADLAKPGWFSEGRYFSQFGDKDGIIRALFHRYWGLMLGGAERSIAGVNDPIEQLRAIAKIFTEVFVEDEHLFRVITSLGYPGGAETKEPDTNFRNKFRRLVLESIQRARNADRLVDSDIPNVVYFSTMTGVFEAILKEFYHAKHHPRRDVNKSLKIEHVDRMMTVVISILFPKE